MAGSVRANSFLANLFRELDTNPELWKFRVFFYISWLETPSFRAINTVQTQVFTKRCASSIPHPLTSWCDSEKTQDGFPWDERYIYMNGWFLLGKLVWYIYIYTYINTSPMDASWEMLSSRNLLTNFHGFFRTNAILVNLKGPDCLNQVGTRSILTFSDSFNRHLIMGNIGIRH